MPALTQREMLLDHDHRIDGLEDWRSEVRGAFTLMRWLMGASALSAVVSIIAIATLIGGRV